MNRIALRFLLHTLVLLTLYALVSLIAALKFLPGDLTQSSLPFNQVSALAAALLDLAIVGGLLGGGIYMAANVAVVGGTSGALSPDSALSGAVRSLGVAVRLWSLLAVLTIAAGILNLLLPLTLPLALLKVAVILLVIASLFPLIRPRTGIALVWTIGLLLSAVCTLLGLLPTDNFVLAAALHTLTSGTNTHVAYVLAAVALAYWLMLRFGDITPESADSSLLTVAGLLALAGALVTVTALDLDLGALRTVDAALVPLLCLTFAAHSYRAFAARSASKTLAAHWTALGILLLVLGEGLLGAANAVARPWIAGTRLDDLQGTLIALAVVAMFLGMCNQAAAEMRAENRRVTGLMPFWLVAFGVIGGGLALAGSGLVQVYLERILSIGYLDVQALLQPLYGLWIGGQGLFALGVMVYTLIFWLRRPRP